MRNGQLHSHETENKRIKETKMKKKGFVRVTMRLRKLVSTIRDATELRDVADGRGRCKILVRVIWVQVVVVLVDPIENAGPACFASCHSYERGVPTG